MYRHVTKMSLSNAKRLYYSNVNVQFNKRKTAAVAVTRGMQPCSSAAADVRFRQLWNDNN